MTKIRQITWMGGSVTKGNHTVSAEFNAFADPEALAIVLASNVLFQMVDLDLCRQVLISPDDLEELRSVKSEKSRLLADLFGGYIEIAVSRGRPAMAMYDPVASAALVEPDAIAFSPARIKVELGGTLSRGRTIVTLNEAEGISTRIGTDIDAERVRKAILSTILQVAA
jgi:purine nucleosidase